jgi:putative glutamine amidotransferase
MRIGLTYTGSDEKHDNYVRWLKDGAADIEVVKLSVDEVPAGDFDALVLSGGVDIHPSLYEGGMDYVGSGKWKEDRDRFEKSVLKRSWERGIPVLGVCRGLQLINVCCGGTLVQDLGVEGDAMHQNLPGNKERGVRPVDKEHDVKVMEGSLLYGIVGGGGRINSAHHQAIGRLGEGLKVNSHADDGVIEGIEWAQPEGRSFMLAVQWHPERMYVNGFKDVGFYKTIRDRFIEEIKKQL